MYTFIHKNFKTLEETAGTNAMTFKVLAHGVEVKVCAVNLIGTKLVMVVMAPLEEKSITNALLIRVANFRKKLIH